MRQEKLVNDVTQVVRQPRAVVAGGSVGGLFIGNMLARQGWQVDIFERVTEGLEARGAGIAGHAELTAALLDNDLTDAPPAGIDVSGRTAFDRHGNEIASFDYPQYLTSWSLIFNLLRQAFPRAHYHAGVELRDVRQSGERAIAILSNGQEIEADLVIGADGIRSRVRAAVAPSIVPEYGGYVAWRGTLDEANLSADFMANTFGKYTFCFPPGGQFIGYPTPGDGASVAPGERRYSYLWYRHVEEGNDLDDLLTDDSGHQHDYSIPPPLIRAEHIESVRRDAERDLPPQFAEVVLRAERNLLQPIYDVESRQIVFGRTVLLGDAAFVARPHVGIGVLKAAQDAAALAASLRECNSIPEALRRYQQERLDTNRDAVRFGRHLGSFIERGLSGPTADPSLKLTFDYIIRESARLPRAEALAGLREGTMQ